MTTPDPRLMAARSYVQTRFFPALPVEYGDLAVEALDAFAEGEPDRMLSVAGLNPQPRGTTEDEEVSASRVVEVLRLQHMLDDEDDEVEAYEHMVHEDVD